MMAQEPACGHLLPHSIQHATRAAPSLAWSRRLLHTTMDGATHEYGHVLKALAHYYNGLHNNDTTTMWKVWHPPPICGDRPAMVPSSISTRINS